MWSLRTVFVFKRQHKNTEHFCRGTYSKEKPRRRRRALSERVKMTSASTKMLFGRWILSRKLEKNSPKCSSAGGGQQLGMMLTPRLRSLMTLLKTGNKSVLKDVIIDRQDFDEMKLKISFSAQWWIEWQRRKHSIGDELRRQDRHRWFGLGDMQTQTDIRWC